MGFTVGAGVGYLLGPAMGFEDSPGTEDRTVLTNCRPSLGESPICDSVFIKGEQAMSARAKGSVVGALILGTAGYFVGPMLRSRWESVTLTPSLDRGRAAPIPAFGLTLCWTP